MVLKSCLWASKSTKVLNLKTSQEDWKELASELTPVLTILKSASITQGAITAEWKEADEVPLFKVSDGFFTPFLTFTILHYGISNGHAKYECQILICT
jgi:hypothetical protein